MNASLSHTANALDLAPFCVLEATDDCLTLLSRIVADRYPFQTVVLLGGGCCDGQQAQVLDKLVLNGQADQLLGMLNFPAPATGTPIRAIEVYAAPAAKASVTNAALRFDISPIPPNTVSDSFSLEIPHGFTLQMTRHL